MHEAGLARPGRAVGLMVLALLASVGCKCGTPGTRAAARGTITSREANWRAAVPSCRGLAAGCGPSGNDDCCKSLPVPGGAFERSYDGVDFLGPKAPATVSDFYLDKYEVTVGRFRMFVNAGLGTRATPPEAGTGAHPKVAGSGWSSAWNTKLPASTNSLNAALKCHPGYQTWTDTTGSTVRR